MTRRVPALSWMATALTAASIALYGLLLVIAPGRDQAGLWRADGVALAGMGLFGLAISLVPFRRGERWAWVVLWALPTFWLAHWLWALPPSRDQWHQVGLLILSALGLAAAAPAVLPSKGKHIDDLS